MLIHRQKFGLVIFGKLAILCGNGGVPATATTAKRVDYEYERAGTANIFMFTEPQVGWREVAVRERKTKLDWAPKWRACWSLVWNNLNSHTMGAFYEAFEPERALRLARRIEHCSTSKHGS